MIRRDAGKDFLLITQNDHALLSAQLARHLGNDLFAPPTPRQSTLAAIALHDCGWSLHDDHPTLNAQKIPLDVFETPPHIVTQAWSASVDRAVAHDDYAGLLVSLHVLRLSDLSTYPRAAHELFTLVKFQQRQIELQTLLRARLDLQTDLPLNLGLPAAGTSDAFDALRCAFKCLQAMDILSLMLCCTQLLFPTVPGILPRPKAAPLDLHLSRDADGALCVVPWPFAEDELVLEIPCKCVAAQPYANDAAFQKDYAAAPADALSVRLRRASGLDAPRKRGG